MKATRPGPTVTLNTDMAIKLLVGPYNAETEDLIWAIADNQTELLKGMQSNEQYNENVAKFIANQ